MILIFWEILCLALFWSVFCRSVIANATTRVEIRLVLWAVGLSALLGMAAPLYGWAPDRVTLIMVSTFVLMQTVMAQLWHHGVPHPFIQDSHKPKRRAADLKS
jgi:hypothetical protein